MYLSYTLKLASLLQKVYRQEDWDMSDMELGGQEAAVWGPLKKSLDLDLESEDLGFHPGSFSY